MDYSCNIDWGKAEDILCPNVKARQISITIIGTK